MRVANVRTQNSWIGDWDELPAEEVQVGLQNFIICVEMLVTAIVHKYTFGHEQYADGKISSSSSSSSSSSTSSSS